MTSVTTSTNGPRETHRPLRADARRNVDKVLRAAEEVFASEGLAVPIDEIARRAGVGVGTVYRHFPTKQALFQAVVIVRLKALVERAKELSEAADAGAALFTFVSELVEVAVKKRDLIDELAKEGMDDEVHAVSKDDLQKAFEVLLQRAQQAAASETTSVWPMSRRWSWALAWLPTVIPGRGHFPFDRGHLRRPAGTATPVAPRSRQPSCLPPAIRPKRGSMGSNG